MEQDLGWGPGVEAADAKLHYLGLVTLAILPQLSEPRFTQL